MASQNQRRVVTGAPRQRANGQRGAQATATAPRANGSKAKTATARGAASRAPAGRPAVSSPSPAAPADRRTPGWLRAVTLVLSLIGLGLAIYLTIAHLAGAGVLLCSNKGVVDCEAVTTSPESEVFGVLPVAELGLAFYVFMSLINLPWLWRPTWTWLPGANDRLRRGLPVLAWRLRLASVIVGIGFILYLVYTELITLRQICLWCTYVHLTTFLLFVTLIVQATIWGSPAKTQPKQEERIR